MAKILYLDDSDTAIQAFAGFLKRSPHSFTNIRTPDLLKQALQNNLELDIIVMEPALSTKNGIYIIKEIRKNPFLSNIPILVCSKEQRREVVHDTVRAGIQNYFFKPYKEQALIDEINKHTKEPWQLEQCGSKERFTNMAERNPERLLEREKELKGYLDKILPHVLEATTEHTDTEMHDRDELVDTFEEASALASRQAFPALEQMLEKILSMTDDNKWFKAYDFKDSIQFALRLIEYRIKFLDIKINGEPEEPEEEVEELTGRANSAEAEAARKCFNPMEDKIEEKIAQIKDYPIIESAAAAFKMAADVGDSHLDDITEMINREPALASSVLQFSNSSHIAPKSPIEDIKQAVAVLGMARVRILALSLKTVPEVSKLFTAINWQDFWMHQVGCAMICENIAKKFQLDVRPEIAYMVGLMHDTGKMLLCQIDPEGYENAIVAVRDNGKSLIQAENDIFGCDNCLAGYIFAKNGNLPHVLQMCILHQHDLQDMDDDCKNMVAILSIADHLCHKEKIGSDGDRADVTIHTLSAHPAWKILRPALPHGFSITKFAGELNKEIAIIKEELQGLLKDQSATETEA